MVIALGRFVHVWQFHSLNHMQPCNHAYPKVPIPTYLRLLAAFSPLLCGSLFVYLSLLHIWTSKAWTALNGTFADTPQGLGSLLLNYLLHIMKLKYVRS